MCTHCLEDGEEDEDEEAFLGKRTSRQESADSEQEESLGLEKLSIDATKPEAEEEEAAEKWARHEQEYQEKKENELADASPAPRSAPLKERNKNQEQPMAESESPRDGKPPSQPPVPQAGAKSSQLPQL